jgi:hypothetical protein
VPASHESPDLAVMGIESELAVLVDGERVAPEKVWGSPSALMGPAPLEASGRSTPLPGGGVLYFDEGVVEIVTPMIELGPAAAARTVRNVWEGIGQVRDRLTAWSAASFRPVRLQGFSTHYNVTFDRPHPPDAARTVEKLALLLAHILPVPVALLGGNRRSTGVGVRPRGHRIEVTADFTPDPGLMVATATLVAGVTRGAMALPSYELDVLRALRLPTVEGVVPGPHSSRRGWLVRDYHFPRSPFTTNVDARVWPTRDGRLLSLRAIARDTAWRFRRALRLHADPFTFRLLFAVLQGRSPSLLELPDRPGAYDDVGGAIRWGEVLPPLQARAADGHWDVVADALWNAGTFEAHVAQRAKARERARRRSAREARRAGAERIRSAASPPVEGAWPAEAARPAPESADSYRGPSRRLDAPGWAGWDAAPEEDRRRRPGVLERRFREATVMAVPFPDRDLARSRYEEIFLRLARGTPVRVDGGVYRPARMRGWSQAVFVRADTGEERRFSIDELRADGVVWLDPGEGA